MIDLQKEAEDHVKTKYSFIITKETDLRDVAVCIVAIEDYIAGANSKYVQAEKLKAQIEVLKELKDENELDRSIVPACHSKIKELKQQLTQLENEND